MDARGPGSDHEELTASRSQRALLFSPRGGGDQLRDQVKENLGHLSWPRLAHISRQVRKWEWPTGRVIDSREGEEVFFHTPNKQPPNLANQILVRFVCSLSCTRIMAT